MQREKKSSRLDKLNVVESELHLAWGSYSHFLNNVCIEIKSNIERWLLTIIQFHLVKLQQ